MDILYVITWIDHALGLPDVSDTLSTSLEANVSRDDLF